MENIKFRITLKRLVIGVGMILITGSLFSQQQITVDVSPTISKNIKGKKELDRKKYFNISVNEVVYKGVPQRYTDKYIKEFGLTMGRSLSMVSSENMYGNSIREDAQRPGYADINFMESALNPNDAGLDVLKDAYGERSDMAMHDRFESLKMMPSFLDTYTLNEGHNNFPVNNDAFAEMTANLMMHKFTDFQRPVYYELVNEPGWQYLRDKRFFEFHTKTKAQFEELNIPTEVGGPCYSVAYFHRNNYDAMKSMTSFIDGTNGSLDFYSFHTYDYMKWDESKKDFIGRVSTGLPQDGTFDALAAYTYNKYGKELTFVSSEHGGYLTNNTRDDDYVISDELAEELIGTGSGFDYEIERRSVTDFILMNSAIANTLTFMDNPHIVKKAVPYIALHNNWNLEFYNRLLVKENYNKSTSNFRETKLMYFYNLFDKVKGRRVKSICNDADIQQQSFVDENKLYMVFHNQSDVVGTINVNINQEDLSLKNMTIRRLGRQDDFRPYFSEENLDSLSNIQISGQESIVVLVEFDETIPEDKELNEIPFYSTTSAQKFTGSKTFTVEVPDYAKAEYATLRVGIGRKSPTASSKNIEITLNGTVLNVPIEDCADRLINETDYGTTRIVNIDPSLLQKRNTVKVKFKDGKEGGVGAVVIRAGIDPSVGLDLSDLPIDNNENLIYPNPASDKVFIRSEVSGMLNILNLNGATVHHVNLNKGLNTIPVTYLNSGIYIAHLVGEAYSKSFSLIIE